jgi:hypothetical protein
MLGGFRIQRGRVQFGLIGYCVRRNHSLLELSSLCSSGSNAFFLCMHAQAELCINPGADMMFMFCDLCLSLIRNALDRSTRTPYSVQRTWSDHHVITQGCGVESRHLRFLVSSHDAAIPKHKGLSGCSIARSCIQGMERRCLQESSTACYESGHHVAMPQISRLSFSSDTTCTQVVASIVRL